MAWVADSTLEMMCFLKEKDYLAPLLRGSSFIDDQTHCLQTEFSQFLLRNLNLGWPVMINCNAKENMLFCCN